MVDDMVDGWLVWCSTHTGTNTTTGQQRERCERVSVLLRSGGKSYMCATCVCGRLVLLSLWCVCVFVCVCVCSGEGLGSVCVCVCVSWITYLFFTSRMATSTRRMKTRTPALMPAIFTTRSVCLAGSGTTSGSSVAPEEPQCLLDFGLI